MPSSPTSVMRNRRECSSPENLVVVLVLLRYLSLTGIGNSNYGAGSSVRINSMTLDGLENAMCITV